MPRDGGATTRALAVPSTLLALLLRRTVFVWVARSGVSEVGAIRMLSAIDLRRRWLATIAITLLIGTVGAIVIATVAGARRSDTALRRFNDASGSANVEVEVGTPPPQQLRAFETAVGSPPVGLIHAYGMSPSDRPNVAMATSVDGTFGTAVDRPRVIAGRLADPRAADEATISESLAQQTGIKLGSVLTTVSLTPEQVASGDFVPKGLRPSFRVVGIVRRPGDLSDLAASGGIITLTPAFDRAYQGKIALFTLDLRFRVQGGAVAIAHVKDVARRMFGSSRYFRVDNPGSENTGAQNAIDVLTTALWIFAVVAASAALFTVGMVVFRELARWRAQQPALRWIGMTRLERVAATVPRSLVMATGGAAIAVIGAIILSPLFPFGIARRADPDPGVHAYLFALGVGAAGILIFVLAVAAAAAIRVTGVGIDRASGSQSIADAFGLSRLRPTVSNGVRMALDPGRDERAVPLRSAFVGAAVGVLGVTAVLVFAASLGNLAHTPRLYGWTWDVKARDPSTPAHCDRKSLDLGRQPGVADIAAICYLGFEIEGRDTVVWGFTQVRGSIEPTIVAGREPSGDDEIALGLDTTNALHKHLGDTVRIGSGKAARAFRIVGRAVFPPMTYGDVQHLADGAAVTGAGFARIVPTDNDATTRYVVARVAPRDRMNVVRSVRALLIRQGNDPEMAADGVSGPTRPPEIDRIRHVAWFLPALAVLMCLLALIAVAHALIVTARRRRRELAVLKAIGFTPGQVRTTLAWEGPTLAIVAVVFGIPVGVIVGRLAWSLAAHNLGVATTAAFPAWALPAVAAATLLLVNAVASLPARAAARTRTSVALAVE
ncbi:MAG TPA: FtsX-like permease family protein [Acidimicrobiia bacterium]|nr:FtsX-like permease family protein [Acidimicrobiia bacterium]